jgi:protein SCO1/2
MRSLVYLFIFAALFMACKQTETLPIYGKKGVKTDTGYDTIIELVKPFEFIDQKGSVVNNATFEGKIFVTDFFFTSCPSICPVMTKQMLRIHDAFPNNNGIAFLSHTIDPVRDSVATLQAYAEKIGITSNERWHFVTGEKDALYKMAENYMITAFEDDEVPGGFEHSGYFILVDGKQQIRGYYDGTDEQDVSLLIEDLNILLRETE